MGKAENYVEGYLKKRTEAHGGMCLKFTSGVTGVPDRIVLLAGHTVFVETKAPGGQPRRLQLHRHGEMRAAGGDVRVIDSRPKVDALLEELLANPAIEPTVTEENP
jgi:hypothetical protein